MRKTTRIVVTLPQYMKIRVEERAEKYECSQAEVIRFALMRLVESEK